jgi:hypothetical protein
MRRPWLLVLFGAAAAGSARPVARLRRAVDVPEPTLIDVLSSQARLSGRLDEEQDESDAETQLCEIECWRGYVTWQFYAGSGSPDEAPLVSPYFRAPGKGAPERTDIAVQAHAVLVEALVAAGWEPEGYGEEWFSERFQRASA